MNKGASCYPSSSILIASQEPSSPSGNCFDRGNLSGLAKCLAFCGFTPIPLKLSGGDASVRLIPAIPWREFRVGSDLEGLGKVREIFAQEGIVGVAIKTGASSGLLVLDIDQPEKFEAFYPLEELIKEAPYVVRSKDPGHYHVGFSWEPEFTENKNFLNVFGFELKVNGLMNFYSILPDCQYVPLKLEPLRPMPENLRQKLRELINAKERVFSKQGFKEEALIDGVLAILDPYFVKGQRQSFVLYTAGLLKKLGVPEETALEKLRAFCKSKADEELSMRLEAVKHTYRKPESEITGFKGLVEGLGVSCEDILKIKALIRDHKGLKTSFWEVWTAEELAKAEFPEPKWLIPNILPEGLSLLSGRPKVGKSWLALGLCIDVARNTGRPVVYFGLEDSKGRLKKRLEVLGGGDLKNLYLLNKWPRLDQAGLKALEELCLVYQPILVVLDPWVKVRPLSPKDKRGENTYFTDYESVTSLKKLTEQGVNILIVHHKRKTEAEDPLEEVLGTTGITGGVDNVLSLKRQRRGKTGMLEIIARDFEEKVWGMDFEGGKWTFQGEGEEYLKEYLLAEEQKRIVETIKQLGGKATIKEVAEYLGKNYQTIKTQIRRLLEKGVLKREAKGNFLLNNECNLCNPSNPSNPCNPCNPDELSPLGLQKVTTCNPSCNPEEPAPDLAFRVKGYKGYRGYTGYRDDFFAPSGSPFEETKEGQSLDFLFAQFKAQPEPQSKSEEDEVLLLMPEEKKCPICGSIVWRVRLEVYNRGKGEGICARCWRSTYFESFDGADFLYSMGK